MAWERHDLDRHIRRLGLRDRRIADAFEAVDRGRYVPDAAQAHAYEDRPVAIPRTQTTSQPSLIANMIDALAPPPDGKILEIGTGYGYQTALLAALCAEVVSVERHEVLAQGARSNLEGNGIDNVSVITGNGWDGYPPGAPYDGVIVSAAASSIPEPLADQLGAGARLVIPLRRGGSDDVMVFTRGEEGLTSPRLLTPARFVPLVRG